MLIVGAGQSGLVTAFGLMRERVRNILVIDRAPAGKEGPWVTFARMPTLRSPKDCRPVPTSASRASPSRPGTRPSMAPRPSPTCTSSRASTGTSTCKWYRRVLGLPVRNDVAATAIAPGRLDDGGPCLLVTLSTGEVLATRKLVLATGQDGTGEWWMPDFVRNLPADRRAHTCELDIDFARLEGKVVAVLGAGASAMDNAAVALEHGAEVHLFTRRRPTGVQRFRWLTFAGFLRHMGDMPDLWRWRFMANILNAREGFPPDTYARVMAFPDTFTMHAERAWTDARMEDDRIRLETTRGPFHADFAICGTGIRQNVHLRPELALVRRQDRAVERPLHAAVGRGRSRCSRPIPISARTTSSSRRRPGDAPWLGDIHVFGIGSTLSFGVSGSSINAMNIAVPKLVASLTRGLFAGDLQRHWQSLLAYDTKLVELDWSKIKTE